METTYKLIKTFEFTADERTKLTFSDPTKVRLNPRTQCIELKDENGWDEPDGVSAAVYPTDDDLYVKTWLWNPKAVQAWVGFDYWSSLKSWSTGEPVGTSVLFRLSADGTTQLWWSGSAWAVPAAGEWNTVQEIGDNIATFPIATKRLQVIINLKTTDPTQTPRVRAVGVLWDAFINFEYDLIFNSLVPLIETIRPAKDWSFPLVTDTDTMVMGSRQEYSVDPFDIQGVVAVYNEDDDPDHTVNLYSAFNTSTRTLTLTSVQAAGKRMWIRFTYKLRCDIMVHQDYAAVDKIPAVILEDIDERNSAQMPGYDAIRDRANKTAHKVHAPYRMTLRITARLVTGKNRDMAALHGDMMRLFRQTPLLKSEGLDEEYSLNLTREFDNAMNPNLSDLKQRRMVFDVMDVNYWVEGDEETGLTTTGLVSSGDVNFTSGKA